jgi:prepilin-type N-terminal cleavage/methylation domain-containing protein
MRNSKRNRGFTLVELTISLIIIALLAGAVFVGGGVLLQQFESKATIKQIIDIRTATTQFRERFKFLPGDLPADTEIQNLAPACVTGGAGVGNGDGLIAFGAAASESSCANDHLFKSGFYKNESFVSKYGAIGLMSRTAGIARFTAVTTLAPAFNVRDTSRNVILFEGIPCFIATAVDEAFDDANLTNNTGTVASLSGACTGNTMVWLAVAL